MLLLAVTQNETTSRYAGDPVPGVEEGSGPVQRACMLGWYRSLSPPRVLAMQESDAAAIAKLKAFVVEAHRKQTDPPQFWIEFTALANGVDERAYLDDADPELRAAFTEVLAHADDAGFAVP
ncbi:MAG: hypothetical protein EOO38_08435 [Cytophagaceae bacterium]|nr:MAG: hypothetical protein EOO38_08435 [Cytophagaceae bacterium]